MDETIPRRHARCERVIATSFSRSFFVAALALVVLSGCQQPAHVPRVAARPPQPVAGNTVIIDAGHGGRDNGAPGVGPLVEKNVNLAIAMRVAQLLREGGVTVVTTRSRDTFISLNTRAESADRFGVDLFVSIHADSAPNVGATGATVYIAEGALNASQDAAGRIHASLISAGVKSRGVRRAKFRVLVGHGRPSVLVECGYLTNLAEAGRLASPAYQGRIAHAIARGVLEHLGRSK